MNDELMPEIWATILDLKEAQEVMAARTLDHWTTIRSIDPGASGVIDIAAKKARKKAEQLKEHITTLLQEVVALRKEVKKTQMNEIVYRKALERLRNASGDWKRCKFCGALWSPEARSAQSEECDEDCPMSVVVALRVEGDQTPSTSVTRAAHVARSLTADRVARNSSPSQIVVDSCPVCFFGKARAMSPEVRECVRCLARVCMTCGGLRHSWRSWCSWYGTLGLQRCTCTNDDSRPSRL